MKNQTDQYMVVIKSDTSRLLAIPDRDKKLLTKAVMDNCMTKFSLPDPKVRKVTKWTI